MANQIRLKRASGSDPSASDLVTGELAVRTDTAKLFTKKDDNSVAEIGASVSADAVDTNAIQDDAVTADKLASNAVVTNSIVNDAVTFAKSQNISTSKILGRTTSGTGNIEEVSPSAIRTLLGLATSATTDTTNASNISSGTLAAARVATLNQDTTGSAATLTTARNIGGVSFNGSANINLPGVNTSGNQDTSGNAATATALETARNIGGVSFDGTGNINLPGVNTSGNQDTSGNAATATALETSRTIAGTSFDGSANIDISYTNLTNKLSVGDGGLTQNNFTNTLKSKLDGIASGATNVTNTNQLTNGAGFITSSNSAITNKMPLAGGTFSGNVITRFLTPDGDGTRDLGTDSIRYRAAYVDNYYGSGANLTNLPSQTDNNFTTTLKNKLDGIASGATNVTNTNQLTNGAGFITATLTNEQVQDIVGGMVTGNTESGITVTYQDSDGTLDFSVASQTDNNFTTTLKNKLDGIAASATNVTNNNQLTNGAGYITSADGGNAATLDSIDSSQFLRSDTTDTASGVLTINGGLSFGADAKCAAGISSLSDGSTITVNFTSGIHHNVTLGGNRTLGHSNTSSAIGQTGSIFISQDSAGSRTLSFNSAYKFAGGTAPTLSTTASAVDRIDYVIKAGSVIHCAFTADVK